MITGADPAATLRALERNGITLQDVEMIDPLCFCCKIRKMDWGMLKSVCERRGESVEIKQKLGLYWAMKGLTNRPVLIFGLLLLLFLTLWVPTRIFFIRVEGNATVPSNLIIENAARCGIHFGVSAREVRNEIMKNSLLEQMPQLQWAGINTHGCVAVISVRERVPEHAETDNPCPSSIVAARDGIIRDLTVLQGSSECTIGQAVTAGELLISGFTDCGLCIRATRAEGEIYAETLRTLSVISPLQWSVRAEKQASIKKYSLIIGKNRINFYNSSGILDAGCVKIYSQQYVVLPGGFTLPIAIVTEEWIPYTYQIASFPEPETILQPFVLNYLQSQMIGGQILSSSQVICYPDGVIRMDGIYGCYEMIGVSVPEERLLEYENN